MAESLYKTQRSCMHIYIAEHVYILTWPAAAAAAAAVVACFPAAEAAAAAADAVDVPVAAAAEAEAVAAAVAAFAAAAAAAADEDEDPCMFRRYNFQHFVPAMCIRSIYKLYHGIRLRCHRSSDEVGYEHPSVIDR